MSSSMNAWVERHATTARLACASSRPSAFRRWVLPSPLFPTSTRGLYFLPGRSSTARTALTATSLDGPTAYPLSGKAPDGPGGGATPPRTLGAPSAPSASRPGSRNTPSPAARGSTPATPPKPPPPYQGPGRAGYGRPDRLFPRRGFDGLVFPPLDRPQPVEGAHQLGHVGELESRHGVEHARLNPRPPLLGLAAQDRDASPVVGQAHVHHQAAREAGDTTPHQGRRAGRAPGASDNDRWARPPGRP